LPGRGTLGHVNTFLGQLPALIGVLVGTLGTILATSLADRTRWKRSQSVRWDERRLEAYAEFARVVKEVHAVALRMLASTDRPGSRGHRLDRETGLARLAEADVRQTLAWETVLLLGDAPAVHAARAWRDAVWAIERLARGLSEKDVNVTDLLHRANEARDAFYSVARGGLGVRGGSVDQSNWLTQQLSGTYARTRQPPVTAASPGSGTERDA
jgi:hypothetical protein